MAKILLVDDEKHILQYYTEELSGVGHQVVAVDSGDQLLNKIALHQPDVIVLDIKLVEWDGLDLLQDIRERYYNLPVILCTAYDTFKEDPRSIAADYYVIKSFDLTELKTKIKRAIDTRLPIHMAETQNGFTSDTI
ncbi:MAG: response regulator [Deltaproteobacteria bacterium]|nr:MAG: response regulator [Deltaproteobacteria bacterium]